MKIIAKIFVSMYLVLFIALQIWCSFVTFHFPYNGIYLDTARTDEWVVSKLEANSTNDKIHIGDKVIAIDGNPPNEWPTVKRWNVVEKADTVVIWRDGVVESIDLRTSRPSLFDIISLAEEFVCLFMCVLLLVRENRSPSARLLAFSFLSAAVIFMSLGASMRGDLIGKLLIASSMMVLPIVFLHFLVVFFKEKGDMELPKGHFKYLYGIALAAFLLRGLYFFPSMAFIYRHDGSVTMGFFIIVISLNISLLATLFVKVRRAQTPLAGIIKSVFYSLLISFLPIICLSFIPQLIVGEWIFDPIYTSWLLLIFPITFSYLIASDQLYDIGLVVRRIVFASLMAVVPVSLFTGAFAIIFHGQTNGKQILFVFLGSIALLSAVLYAAEYWTTRLEPYLFPRKYILQSALKKISKNLGTISSFRDLKDIILVDIVGTLQVTGGAIVFRHKNDIEIICEGEVDTAEIQHLVNSSAILDHPYYTFLEMNCHEEYTSYLIVTRKKTNTRIAKEEWQWLQLITSYLEVSMENVYLIRKLTGRLQQMVSHLPQEEHLWLRKVMFELQEEERVRIATDLHDTTMQDLFFLKRRLTSLAEKPSMRQEDREQLNSMNNFVEMINASLRQSCFELNPHLLKEVGLKQTLKTFVEKESYTTPFDISFRAEQISDIEGKDLSAKRHIFRIVQELLNNAKKHSQAANVSFHLWEEENFFYLSYRDDGVGFLVKEEVAVEIAASGMGLAYMRSRVLHVGGSFELETAVGEGTHILITIPTEEVMSA
ncbi:ATP-binding protein [Paenibacillus qinlingensis]|uniref:histidine kinase n=1 Tax=Paenibacillus qinlingensis TaxID=1837343 RepID=A0ABU1P4D5_9BACL|nr:ATP-binding protein [Paenibacillus qinlingensis]MDR6554620.1 two-component system sensor histidine kinase ComP [Paenibacillus qinlingensis]